MAYTDHVQLTQLIMNRNIIFQVSDPAYTSMPKFGLVFNERKIGTFCCMIVKKPKKTNKQTKKNQPTKQTNKNNVHNAPLMLNIQKF